MWSCAMKCLFATFAALGTIEATELVIGLSLPLGASDEGLNVPASRIRDGLTLLANYVNEYKIFKDLRGGELTFRFLIKDDEGHDRKAIDEYDGFMRTHSADMMLGPYGETAITQVAQLVYYSGYAQVLHNYGLLAQSLPQRMSNQPGAFSVSVQVKEALLTGIGIMKSRGASSIALMLDAKTASYIGMCKSAAEVAAAQGFEIKGMYLVNDATEAIERMQFVAAIDPDVLVLCASVQRMQHLVAAAAGVELQTKAILATGVSSDIFVSSMGSSLASYLLTSVDWHKDADMPCKAFGNNKAFVERYRADYGIDPNDYVASAVAAGIALMEGASNAVFQGDYAEKQKQLSDSLNKINIPSLFGTLNFNTDAGLEGTLKFLQAKAVQLIPTEDFGVTSSLISPSNASAMIWPMPAWAQKNAYLKICQPGYYPGVNFREPAINRSELECIPCPAGKSTYGESDVCNACDTGTYAKDEGSVCRPCLPGSICDEPGMSVPNASKDHYLLTERSDKELLYVTCSPKFLCLGKNTCEGFNAGVLCRACTPGYTNTGFYRRYHQCFPCSGAWLLAGVAMLILLFNLWLGHLCCDSRLSGTAHVVKRLISYAQLCGIAMQAGDLHTVAPILGMLADFAIMPFQTVLGPDCLFTVEAISGASGAIDYADLAEKKRAFIRLFPLACMAFLVFSTTTMCLAISIFQFAQKDGRRRRSSPEESFRGTMKRALWWCARWSIFWLYLYYVPGTSMLLNSIQFIELDTSRLRHYPDVIATLSSSVASIACLSVFSVITPASVFYLLWRNRNDLETEQNIEIFGFLYSDFLPDYWQYERRFFLFKFFFMLCLIIPGIAPKLFFMLVCLFLHSLSFACWKPFSYRDEGILSKLETCCIAAVACILFSQNLHSWKITRVSADQIGAEPTNPLTPGDIVLYLLVWSCHAYCLLRFSVWFYKTVIFEHIRLKAHALPESLNAVERKLSASLQVRTLEWLSHIQTLDITELSRSEKQYLLGVFETATNMYIEHGKLFHPSFMVVALEEAMKTCVMDRRAKVDAEHPFAMSQLRSKGVLGCFLFWFPWGSKMLGMHEVECLDAKTLRLERQSRLRALRKCSINRATTDEFQDALQDQFISIKHQVQKFYTMMEIPGFLRLPDDHHGDPDAVTNRQSIMNRRASGEKMLYSPDEDLLEVMMAEANAATLESMNFADLQAEASARDLGSEGTREELIERLKASTPIEAKAEHLEARIPELMDEAAMLRAEVDRLQEEIRQVEEEAAWAYEEEDQEMEAVTEEQVGTQGKIQEEVPVDAKIDPPAASEVDP